MINQKDILAMLQEGVDADVLANEFAQALNGAIAEKKKADEAASLSKRKEERIAEILNLFMDYIEEFLPEFYDITLRSFDPALAVKALDDASKLTKEIEKTSLNLEDIFKEFNGEGLVKIEPVKRDPIAEFLKRHKL